MIFGLYTTPPEIQRFIEGTFFNIKEDFAFAYQDDGFVFSGIFLAELNHLPKVLQRLRERRIKIKVRKS